MCSGAVFAVVMKLSQNNMANRRNLTLMQMLRKELMDSGLEGRRNKKIKRQIV